ncbi:conserved hypothetical protein [Bosea sp. 62]|uniref:UPF0262 family protein n=1 Tax=unclassified Bosea (in: a-proteobacteria) TaxID=2653178 RepID=UPI001251DD9F|nr:MULTISPECIES: UPF0262 family protein [unclassified Bosea (in: a-proteobacteria)]CAD5296429.1 conserved hypothetical protein [Bosea sp. 21B]CAD5296805.1 conserved hypothetical protein [Bosea sp. 46]CAD5297326.1 conserved hypothetical protein [Bosea sp. 7B]VVT61138.1 conserved hypothetical protein [Bosea sp. EC-HK365B]VXB16218.1 conserved hypothetical protein [Bosea sp. 125]
MSERSHLVAVTLDEASLGRGSADQEHERAVAIYDLIERNHFALPEFDGGPYAVHLALVERRLAFEVRSAEGAALVTHHLSLTPFKRIIKDYELVCDSYYAAIRTATPAQIEAIDMGRRGLHDEAAVLLVERLSNKVEIDNETARRLFTLIYALHWKG